MYMPGAAATCIAGNAAIAAASHIINFIGKHKDHESEKREPQIKTLAHTKPQGVKNDRAVLTLQ